MVHIGQVAAERVERQTMAARTRRSLLQLRLIALDTHCSE